MSKPITVKTVTLDFPIDLDAGRKLTSLSFRRVKADDAEVIHEITNGITKTKKLIELIGSATNDPDLPLTPRLIGQIDIVDLQKISEELEDFLPAGRKAGAGK